MRCRDCERPLHAASRYILILHLLSWSAMASHSTDLALNTNNEHLIRIQQRQKYPSEVTLSHSGHMLRRMTNAIAMVVRTLPTGIHC
jgi:hypothetical protein